MTVGTAPTVISFSLLKRKFPPLHSIHGSVESFFLRFDSMNRNGLSDYFMLSKRSNYWYFVQLIVAICDVARNKRPFLIANGMVAAIRILRYIVVPRPALMLSELDNCYNFQLNVWKLFTWTQIYGPFVCHFLSTIVASIDIPTAFEWFLASHSLPFPFSLRFLCSSKIMYLHRRRTSHIHFGTKLSTPRDWCVLEISKRRNVNRMKFIEHVVCGVGVLLV